MIENALRESLAPRPVAGDREPGSLLTFKGKGLLLDIDLDDSASLQDLIDARDDPD